MMSEGDEICSRPGYARLLCRVTGNKWFRRLLIFALVLIPLAKCTDSMVVGLGKGVMFPGELAAKIAVGLYTKENGYYFGGHDLVKEILPPEMLEPNCRRPQKEDKPAAHYFCLFAYGLDEDECGFFREPGCQPYEVSAYILSRPDLLAKIIDALLYPCRYLPGPEELQAMRDPEYQAALAARKIVLSEGRLDLFKKKWLEAQCDQPGERMNNRQIMVFFRENGREVMRLEKHRQE